MLHLLLLLIPRLAMIAAAGVLAWVGVTWLAIVLVCCLVLGLGCPSAPRGR